MSRSNGQAGFTLIEMVVVIAVLGLIIGMLAGFGPPQSRWAQTRVAAQSVAAAMRHASIEAIIGGHKVKLRLPPLPGWIAVTLPQASIIFEPDGSNSGGEILLADNNRAIGVTADWLTGRISIDAP